MDDERLRHLGRFAIYHLKHAISTDAAVCVQSTRLVLNLRACSIVGADAAAGLSNIELRERLSFAQRETDFSVTSAVRLGDPERL